MSASLTCSPLHTFCQFPVVFISQLSPCSLLHPLVLRSSYFSVFLSLLASLWIFCCISVSLFQLLIPASPSSRQMAGVRVMVMSLGWKKGYIIEDIPVSFPSAASLCSPSLSSHFPEHLLSLPNVCRKSFAFLLSFMAFSSVHVCVFTDRMGFCGVRRTPEWGSEQIGV